MIESTHHVLAVPDLARSAAFYRDVLGFEVFYMSPGWLRFISGNCRIMAGECPDAIAPIDLGDHNYFTYFKVDNVDEWFERVTAHEAVIVKPLSDEPWGNREFGLRTMDGHRMMLGQGIG